MVDLFKWFCRYNWKINYTWFFRLESFWLWCVTVCDPETSLMGLAWPLLGCCAGRKNFQLQQPFFKRTSPFSFPRISSVPLFFRFLLPTWYESAKVIIQNARYVFNLYSGRWKKDIWSAGLFFFLDSIRISVSTLLNYKMCNFLCGYQNSGIILSTRCPYRKCNVFPFSLVFM